ncbi:hypothetical protein [Hymenobacter nivis]|uniref:hypothetical protein n=1 Tax=Hymenobacter nivis TaxID=1850093 RepID=UPI001FE2468B|nr:hypothetical protein [Hymenobacter nivis]
MADLLDSATSRRDFMCTLSLGAGALLTGPAALAGLAGRAPAAPGRPPGVALMGLGSYSAGQLAPAL